jgi:mRNA interferase MazF
VCLLTRDAAIQVLSAVTCAPITRTIRGIRSEVEVGPDEGLPEVSVITCDNIVTLPISMLTSSRVGHLGIGKRVELDHALRYALDIQY